MTYGGGGGGDADEQRHRRLRRDDRSLRRIRGDDAAARSSASTYVRSAELQVLLAEAQHRGAGGAGRRDRERAGRAARR